MKFSIIIAVYNEETVIKGCIERILKTGNNIEIIVVDGQSQDKTYQVTQSLGVQVYSSLKGRGRQFNMGAQKAAGDILLFLHADSLIPADALKQIKNIFRNESVNVGKFRMLFDCEHWILKLYAYFTRFDSILSSFGDQGIVVRKKFFSHIGGFPEWPLFEDVHFFRTARKQTKIHCLPGPIVTSARKFLARGLIKQQLMNGLLIFKYLLGVSPQKLSKEYYKNSKAK